MLIRGNSWRNVLLGSMAPVYALGVAYDVFAQIGWLPAEVHGHTAPVFGTTLTSAASGQSHLAVADMTTGARRDGYFPPQYFVSDGPWPNRALPSPSHAFGVDSSLSPIAGEGFGV